jgi:transcription antitermination protein NusB
MSKRRRSREIAFSLIYQMEINDQWTISNHTDNLKKLAKGDDYIGDYALRIIDIVLNNKEKIDNLISQYSKNWSFERISIVDKSILRMAISELYLATPKTAVINEALEIADKYGEKDSKSFINGLLDTISLNL